MFWFLKDGAQLDLEKPYVLDMYVQQTVTRGRDCDVRKMVQALNKGQLHETFMRIKNFIPYEVRSFWEDYFEYVVD